MSTRGQMIQISMSDGAAVGAYHVQPGGQRLGGLVLVQEIFGVNEHIREQSDRFADLGYEVIAPALFDREAPGFEVGYGPEDKPRAIKLARELHPFALSVADVQVCINMLKALGPVFLTGYCYGGSVTWAAACRCDGLDAASGYYGSLIPALAEEKPRCPVILHFGRHDASIPMEGLAKIQAAHPEIPVHLYDAGHGFGCDHRPDYHEQSAKLAFERTVALFRQPRNA